MTRLPLREHDEHVGFSCLLHRRRGHRDRRCRVAAKVPGTCNGCLHDVRRAYLEVIPVDRSGNRSGSGHRLATDTYLGTVIAAMPDKIKMPKAKGSPEA